MERNASLIGFPNYSIKYGDYDNTGFYASDDCWMIGKITATWDPIIITCDGIVIATTQILNTTSYPITVPFAFPIKKGSTIQIVMNQGVTNTHAVYSTYGMIK